MLERSVLRAYVRCLSYSIDQSADLADEPRSRSVVKTDYKRLLRRQNKKMTRLFIPMGVLVKSIRERSKSETCWAGVVSLSGVLVTLEHYATQ